MSFLPDPTSSRGPWQKRRRFSSSLASPHFDPEAALLRMLP